MSPKELGLTMRMEEIAAFKLDRINRIYRIAKSIARGSLIQHPPERKNSGVHSIFARTLWRPSETPRARAECPASRARQQRGARAPQTKACAIEL